ncbi:MAG: Trm112 family protein, partial [Candidatus Parcubacteria bacterium]|nr:Trm112 family protein [Candidatus Parcubacteria bacterium]
MRKNLLNFIACPICKKADLELQLNSENSLEIREGQLLCRSCRTIFLIKRGIIFFDKNISQAAQKEKIATEEDIEEQKDSIISQDENWLLNFPFNKK